MDRSGNTYTKEGLTRRELTPQEKAEIQMVRDSDAGKKLFAEHAIQAFEERLVHLNQFPERQILSPTYARFVEQHATNSPSDDLFNLGIGRENKGLDDVKGTGRSLRTIEQEVPMLLYDAGMPVEMISQQMEKNHPYRKEVLDFLREQQAHETPASGSDAT
jgi:hypothetical protein